MTVLFVLVGIAVVLAVGLLSVGRLGELPPAPPDRTPDRIPAEGPLEGADLDAVRFDVGFRGYRMDEVDRVLDRVAADLAARDAEIAALHARLGEAGITLVADESGTSATAPLGADGEGTAPLASPGPDADEAATDPSEPGAPHVPVDRRGPLGPPPVPVDAPPPDVLSSGPEPSEGGRRTGA